MLKLFQKMAMPYTCVVRGNQDIQFMKQIATTTNACAGYKRYDRSRDSIRQTVGSDDEVTPKDGAPVPSDKTFGSISFPTLETFSQSFEGVKFTDLPIVHVKSTSNNTILCVTDGEGVVLAQQSAGTVGFRNAKKGTNVAAQAAAIALAGDALRKDIKTVRVCLRGIGPGRLPALKALHLSGMNVVSITDTTRLPHNGNRPKKARRL